MSYSGIMATIACSISALHRRLVSVVRVCVPLFSLCFPLLCVSLTCCFESLSVLNSCILRLIPSSLTYSLNCHCPFILPCRPHCGYSLYAAEPSDQRSVHCLVLGCSVLPPDQLLYHKLLSQSLFAVSIESCLPTLIYTKVLIIKSFNYINFLLYKV